LKNTGLNPESKVAKEEIAQIRQQAGYIKGGKAK